VKFKQEHINTLNLGFQYALEKHPEHFLNNLIIETENAIKHLAPPLQSAYRPVAFKKLKERDDMLIYGYLDAFYWSFIEYEMFKVRNLKKC
jgi:hypothetical protein